MPDKTLLESMQEVISEDLEIMREVISEDIQPLIEYQLKLEKDAFNKAYNDLLKLEAEEEGR